MSIFVSGPLYAPGEGITEDINQGSAEMVVVVDEFYFPLATGKHNHGKFDNGIRLYDL